MERLEPEEKVPAKLSEDWDPGGGGCRHCQMQGKTTGRKQRKQSSLLSPAHQSPIG